jgi:TPR repeat protein
MNVVFKMLALGMAVALIAGCSDSVNTGKPKKIVDPWENVDEPDFVLLMRRAEAGDASAQNALGLRYSEGNGVAKDPAQAVTWWRKAAEQGFASAQYSLGVVYIYGEGVPKDAAQAVAWWRKAAEKGNADAQFGLGVMYHEGEGVPKDAVQAVAWYRKAAEQGHVLAQRNLGLMYDRGKGVPKDAAQAVVWLRKAAEQGDAVAQNALGLAYDNGEGVPKDAVQAVLWFRKAAEQGDAHAQHSLAVGYFFGRGVPSDAIQAYMWANLAAAQGNERGAGLRDLFISKDMTPAQIAEAQRLTREWKPGQHTESATVPDSASNGTLEKALTGTAFVVSSQGHLLTNRHVVGNCQQVRLAGSDKPLKLLPQDEANDLALLQMTGKPKAVAVFRAANDLRQGESIAAYGYPLQGTLAAGGNLSPGVVSALAGLGNNTSQIQITAPVQQGNSGGPVLDGKGQVVGVVVQKLDAVKVAKLTGDVPQNVNFAVNASTTRAFLDSNQVQYKMGGWWNIGQKDLADIAEDARTYTVVVECWK